MADDAANVRAYPQRGYRGTSAVAPTMATTSGPVSALSPPRAAGRRTDDAIAGKPIPTRTHDAHSESAN